MLQDNIHVESYSLRRLRTYGDGPLLMETDFTCAGGTGHSSLGMQWYGVMQPNHSVVGERLLGK